MHDLRVLLPSIYSGGGPRQYNGTYTDVFSGEEAIIDEESKMQLVPWGYGVFSQQS